MKDWVALWYLITAGRIQYASLWKKEEIPKIEDWIISFNHIIEIIEMDKITRKLRQQ